MPLAIVRDVFRQGIADPPTLIPFLHANTRYSRAVRWSVSEAWRGELAETAVEDDDVRRFGKVLFRRPPGRPPSVPLSDDELDVEEMDEPEGRPLR